jgi:hypothetical protein
MSTNLIDEIRTAKESVQHLETEASEAGYNLRLAKDRLKEGGLGIAAGQKPTL